MNKMKKRKTTESTITKPFFTFVFYHTFILLIIDKFYPLDSRAVGIYSLIIILLMFLLGFYRWKQLPKEDKNELKAFLKEITDDSKHLKHLKEYFELKSNVDSVLQSLINETQYKPILLEEYLKLPSLSIVQIVNLLLDQEPINLEKNEQLQFTKQLLKYLTPNSKSKEIIDAVYSSLYFSYSFEAEVEDRNINIRVFTQDNPTMYFDTIKIIDLVLSNKDLKHLTKKHIYEELKLAQKSLISS